MRGKSMILGVLLAGSVLLNVVLMLRRTEAPEAARPGPPKASSSEERELREELDRARIELAALKAEPVRQSAPSSPAASEPEDRVGQFRSRLKKLYTGQRERLNRDPVELARENELKAEFNRLELDRQQDPGTYGKCLAVCLEQILAELRPPLDQSQRVAADKLLRESESRFAKVTEDTTAGRVAAELRLQADLWDGLKQALSGDQAESLRTHHLSWMLDQGPLGGLSALGSTNAEHLAAIWGESLGATQEQFTSFIGQAKFYFETLQRQELEAAPDRDVWAALDGRKGFELRARARETQAEALKALTPFLTPDQIRQLRTMVVHEYLVYFPDKEAEK